MASCRKHTQKYLADQLSYDDAHDALNRLLGGGVQFTKKEERDHLDMERYALTLKHLLKYLRVQQTPKNVITPQQKEGELNREEALKRVVKTSNQILLGSKFRVFHDLSIEVPINFKDEEFDEFLVEVHRRGIYDTPYSPEPIPEQMKA